jgi:hypothetical protein
LISFSLLGSEQKSKSVDCHISTEQFVQKSAFPTMDVPAFQNNEKRQTTGAFLSSLSIICRFSISGALPPVFLSPCPEQCQPLS